MKLFLVLSLAFLFSACIRQNESTVRKPAKLSLSWEIPYSPNETHDQSPIPPDLALGLKEIGDNQYVSDTVTKEAKQVITVEFLREIEHAEMAEILPKVKRMFKDRPFTLKHNSAETTTTKTISIGGS